MNFSRLPLLWKIWLSTSVAITGLFLATGIYGYRTIQQETTRSLQDEARASSEAYDAMLEARAAMLDSITRMMAATPRVGDAWKQMASKLEPGTFVMIANPAGERLAVLSGNPPLMPSLPRATGGFYVRDGTLYQIAVTPAGADFLVAGFVLDHAFARRLKKVAGNSEFILAARGQIYASTLSDKETGTAVRSLVTERKPGFANDGERDYVPISRALISIDGQTAGRLFVLRPFAEAEARVSSLRRRILAMWALAVILGLGLSYLAARRVVRPILDLDEAASQVSQQNYDIRVHLENDDELGRLAGTFNRMCESLRAARQELIRRERLGAIARIASSIVHDLRNPLAAISGGAEMLVDTQLSPEQTRRIAENMQRSSQRIQALLTDLNRVSRGSPIEKEPVELLQLVANARTPLETAAAQQRVQFDVRVPSDLVVDADSVRLERVFQNLMQNSIDVMPGGGRIGIEAAAEGRWVMIEVTDNGPGIPPELRGQLFQPFSSHGKKQGLGLGLALARQTVLDHGGDLWAAEERGGARFVMRLPRSAPAEPKTPRDSNALIY